MTDTNDNLVVFLAASLVVATGVIAWLLWDMFQVPVTAVPRVHTEPLMTNKEEIIWTDWRGEKRKIEIHREVR